MEERMEIIVTCEDGQTWRRTIPAKLWQCLADRVQFERRFGVPAVAYGAHIRAGTLPDEWPLFYAWRRLVRDGGPAGVPLEFDRFVEQVTDLDLLDPDAPEDAPDEPTVQPEAEPLDPTEVPSTP
jgi:hypothetical protein